MSKLYVNEIVEATPGSGVAIPGHVVQELFFIQGTPTIILSTTTGTFSNHTFSSLGATSTRTFTKKYDNSTLIIESVCHTYPQQSGSAGQWVSAHQRIKVNGVVIRSTTEASNSDTYGSGYNSVLTNSYGRNMHYNTLVAEATGIASGSVTVTIEGASDTSNTSGDVAFNRYGQGHIRITEIAQ